ncbi:hypothetical protein D3C80_1651970 [compost metagenome]
MRRRKRPKSCAIGTMRKTIIVSRNSPERRSTSSDTERRRKSALLPANWDRRDWAITNSPTRSINSSNRSAGTRTFSLPLECLASAGTGADCAGLGCVATASSTTGVSCAASMSSTLRISISISSMTKMKTSSMADCGCSVVSVTDHPI